MEASVFVVVAIIVDTLVVIVVVVTFIIVITLEPSQELPKKFQPSKLKTVEASVFVVVVIIVVTLVLIVHLLPDVAFLPQRWNGGISITHVC